VLLVALFVAGCTPRAPALPVAPLANAADDSRASALHATCVAFAAKHGAVGMGVAVIEHGRVVLDDAIGFADREAGRAAKVSTLYRLGSISKPVCAAIAMQLVEQGALALDHGIAEYIQGLPGALQPLTLQQLLSHTSGVRHYAADREDNGTLHRSTREALELFMNDPLLFAPGSKYSYSTHAFTLVVAAIEAATKRDYVAVLRERVQPVAPALDCEVLTDTKPERASLYERLDSGEAVASPVREDNSWKYGGGGLESTALDLARFAQAMLEDRLVSAKTRALMWSPIQLTDGSKTSYGLGWGVAPGGSSVSHSGAQQGCHSMLLVVPSKGLVIAVMSNTESCGAPGLAEELRKQLESGAAAREPAAAK
jgi:CubicO group peptidase (beta-lactamase class C family)